MLPSQTSFSESGYTLRIATLEDAYDIWNIMVQCSQLLEHKEHFICDDLNYVKTIITTEGFGIVACDTTGTIVGNLLVKYPGITKENLGYDVFIPVETTFDINHNINTKSDTIPLYSQTLEKVVHMDSASVLPEHRGHGLQRQMITLAEVLIDKEKYHYSFATVAPDNTASLKSLQKNGYEILITKEKYGGVLRHIMMKKLI